MMQNFDEIIDSCRCFLKKSSNRYSSEISKQVNDLEAFQGNFWTDSVKKQYLRSAKKRYCLHFSDWSVLPRRWRLLPFCKATYRAYSYSLRSLTNSFDCMYLL